VHQAVDVDTWQTESYKCANILHITNKRQARRPASLPRNQITSGKWKTFPATASARYGLLVVSLIVNKLMWQFNKRYLGSWTVRNQAHFCWSTMKAWTNHQESDMSKLTNTELMSVNWKSQSRKLGLRTPSWYVCSGEAYNNNSVSRQPRAYPFIRRPMVHLY
jgi:hypothetical protein